MLSKNMQSFVLVVTLLLFGLVIPVRAAKAENAEQPQVPAYCIESQPDYDAEKCEAEDPLAGWRRKQEEQEGKRWHDQGCHCPEPAKDAESEDPLHRWQRLQCERECGQ